MRLDNFLEAFYPDENENVYIRGFSPKEMPSDQKLLTFTKIVTRKHLRENKLIQNTLLEKNKTHGMYFVPNAGGFNISEITRYNAVFCEMDNRSTMIEQHDEYDNGPLTPSLRLEAKKSVHAYWLLSEPMLREEWEDVQNGLVAMFKSDGGLDNPNRLMRLPHFNHLSWADDKYIYKRVTSHTFRPDWRYTVAELKEAFPYTRPKKVKPTFTGEYDNQTIAGIQQELRYRISLLPSYRIESDGVHASAQGACHDGASKTALMVNVRTGQVFCHAGCDFWKIAESFGLSRPSYSDRPIRLLRKPQISKTAEMLSNYVRKI